MEKSNPYKKDETVIEFLEFSQAETVQDLLSTFKDIEDEIYKACGIPDYLMGDRYEER